MKSHRPFLLAFSAAGFFALPLAALAQNPEQALLADFPPKSIDSVERANEAIRRVPDARRFLDRRFEEENAECLQRFFAASCLTDLHTRERKAYKTVNRVDVEAKAFLRRERAAERDRAVAEREQRAAETGGKAISISVTERKHQRDESTSGDAPPPKQRVHVERVRESGEISTDPSRPSDEWLSTSPAVEASPQPEAAPAADAPLSPDVPEASDTPPVADPAPTELPPASEPQPLPESERAPEHEHEHEHEHQSQAGDAAPTKRDPSRPSDEWLRTSPPVEAEPVPQAAPAADAPVPPEAPLVADPVPTGVPVFSEPQRLPESDREARPVHESKSLNAAQSDLDPSRPSDEWLSTSPQIEPQLAPQKAPVVDAPGSSDADKAFGIAPVATPASEPANQ